MSPFNEIYDEIGTKRPAYAAFEARLGTDVTQVPSTFLTEPNANEGTGIIYPLPLILDETDFREVLVPGVLQRAFALQELFADIALGTGKIISSGLLNEEELSHILRAEGTSQETIRQQWQGQAREQIRFVYGPDIVRDPSGDWIVLEDNIGCVGGMASGLVVLNAFLAQAGYSLHPDVTCCSDLQQSVLAFLERTGMTPHQDRLYGIPGTTCSNDIETSWKATILRSLGIVACQSDALLDELAAGVAPPTAIVNLSTTMSTTYHQLAEGLFTKRAIPVFGAPSVEVVASKSFHALGDALLKLYINDPPLLTTPPSQLLREVPSTLRANEVLKRSSGCQGTEVYFVEEENHSTLLDTLRSWGPCGGVLQEYVRRSVLASIEGPWTHTASVEIRPIVYIIGWRTAIVADVVNGRAVVGGGNRRGNISCGAQFLPVLREPVSRCDRSP